MKILVLDNYDSFTYNLVHLLEKIVNGKIDVFLNDEINFDIVKQYDKILLSPGPGIPDEAGQLLPLIREYASQKSLLGVCLGHQAIGEVFGARLLNLPTVYHGVTTKIRTEVVSPLFAGLPEEFEVGRYHSWIIDDKDFPEQLEVTARDIHGHIMAIRHREYDVQGVQFHPESVLTPAGEQILRNWIER